MISRSSNEKQSNIQLQRWIAIVSAFLLVIKFTAYYITHSVAILTDALESIVNVVAGFIGLYSLYVSAKPKDKDHPYGHGKAEFVSAAIEGTLVLSAGLLIIYNAAKRLIYPGDLDQLDIGMILVGSTALINWILGWFARNQGERHNSLALIASGKHLQTDTYSTIAIIAGLWLMTYTGYAWIDSAVAMIFGFYIIYTGYTITRLSLAGIMDEADMSLLEKMVKILGEHKKENWVDLHNFRVIKYGNVLHVDCHLTVPWYLNIHQAHAEIDELAKLIRDNFGQSLELFVHSDGCLYFQCHICEKKDCPVRQHDFKKRVEWNMDTALQNEKHGMREAMSNGQ